VKKDSLHFKTQFIVKVWGKVYRRI